jgi:cytochrome c oxidase subunit I
MGVVLSGLGTILSGVNFVTTIICMRAPGMTMCRMPIFTWNILLTSVMVLIAFPVLAAALLVLEIDRKLGAQMFSASSGGAVMWQNLFWFFGHPEVYIVAIPFFGIARCCRCSAESHCSATRAWSARPSRSPGCP